MKVKVYNVGAQETGTIELPDAVFGLKWNGDLVHQVVTSIRSNMRHPVADAKDRAEVRGGGKKPWRQKGTGRARHGSIRSPIWKGGGVTHGPLKEKNYKKKINRKMARKALYTVLSAKAREGEIVVVDAIEFPDAKTKQAAAFFSHFVKQKEFARINKGKGALVLLPGRDSRTERACNNIPFVGYNQQKNTNVYEVLQYKYVLMPEGAIKLFAQAERKH